MSDNRPVIPGEVPVFTGNEEVLDEKVKALSGHGVKVATAATDIHTTFGGLRAFYQAPEAEQLFATTKPVTDKANQFSSDMCVIAGALGTYANTIRPLVKRLEELRIEAENFRTKIADDDKWREDGDLVDENNDRRNAIAEVWAQFQEAERSCHAKIVALVGGTPLKVNDGSKGEGMYGYDAESLKQAESLPWGDAVEESIPWYHLHEHAWEFGKGFVVDGVWGTIRGLGTLVGVDGWDAAGQAWTGLGKLLTGVAITAIPGVGAAYWSLPDDKLPAWLRDSRTAVKETGKALVAWDKWGENPSRAAGEVTFNVLTTVFTGGAGGAVAGTGKAGAAAKALSLANKAGKAVDPMTYVFKGAGAGVTKIGNIMADLKGKGTFEIPDITVDGAIALPDGAKLLPDGTINLPSGTPVPEGALKLPDGTVRLPENTVTLPPGTVKLPGDGPAQFMDPPGNLYDAKGNIVQKAEDAPKGPEPTAAPNTDTTTPRPDTPATARIPERELAGVGARNTDNAINLGSDLTDPLRHTDTTPTPHHPDTTPGGTAPDHMPGGRADHGMPSNDLNTPRGGQGDTPPTNTPHTDGPTTGSRPDNPGGTGHTDASGGPGHPDGPSTGATHPNTPGTGSLDNLGSGADDAARAADDAAAHRAEYEAAREKPASERTAAERAAITREHVRLANEDPVWRAEHYDKWGLGKRNNADELVDGQLLPKLVEKPDGSWMSASEIPYADPERFHLTPLERGRNTVAPDDLKHLDEVAAKRYAGMELSKAQAAFDNAPTAENAQALADAQKHFDKTVGVGVANNSKLGEALGEEAARRHMLQQKEFEGAREITDLPETPNGSRRFDQLWRDKDGNLVIVEAKAPSATLDWRQSNSHPVHGDPDNVMMVKQGTIEYVRTVVADMKTRALVSPKDGMYAMEIDKAIENGTLRYVLVQAAENTGQYAGAKLKHFKIF